MSLKIERPRLVAITGGIGSGKSVISSILRIIGYQVYDCDSRAKSLMSGSEDILEGLTRLFGCNIVNGGIINRKELSKIVFNDRNALKCLNSLVHPAVIMDIQRWRKTLDGNVAFIETAILAESGLDKVVDSVWQVVADENVRIKRVVERNNMPEQNVKERIAAQTCVIPDRLPVNFIDNNGDKSILPQIMSLLNILD